LRSKPFSKPIESLNSSELKRKRAVGNVMTRTLAELSCLFVENRFEWLLPVVLSRTTDPLWPDPNASLDKRVELEAYGETVRTTASMIIHKMVACSLLHKKIFILSPNVRLEKVERAATGIHAFEFTQLDFEIRNASSVDVRTLVETILTAFIEKIRKTAENEFEILGTKPVTLKPPFPTHNLTELTGRYGNAWETEFTAGLKKPAWIVNMPREFYDYENFETGKWDNYDLFLPHYGEVLSGAKRECEYSKLLKKIDRDHVEKSNYKVLLNLAKSGRLKPSAGAGIGIERLVGWLTGTKHLGEVQPFPKIPGEIHDL